MFVGIPCQCGDLISYLEEKRDNLICIDFVCHEVSSRKVWHGFLEGQIKDNRFYLKKKNTAVAVQLAMLFALRVQ